LIRKHALMGRKPLLDNLVGALLREWGVEEVRTSIERVAAREKAPLVGRSVKKRARKPLAVEQVEQGDLANAQLPLLREIALRFDRKQFLPSNSDVREFLIMLGERPTGMKDRCEAFRQLLVTLRKYPAERLEQLLNNARSGPSQLGPLSDAISATAASLPRFRQGDS
jgi:hypothetical protein